MSYLNQALSHAANIIEIAATREPMPRYVCTARTHAGYPVTDMSTRSLADVRPTASGANHAAMMLNAGGCHIEREQPFGDRVQAGSGIRQPITAFYAGEPDVWFAERYAS